MDLRSSAWFAAEGKIGVGHRSWLRSEGLPDDSFQGRPVIGICNSWSELTPCNAHLRALAEHVKRGIWQAGGVPLEFPTMSLGEPLMRPSAMAFRNLMSMDVEETLRANPLDGVVLLGGCDKTTPALLMGAASVDLPTILVTGGPMLSGRFEGRDLGSGTDLWRLDAEVRAGRLPERTLLDAESCMARSPGFCMTMGSASTMACLSEVLGIQAVGTSTIAAVDARRSTGAHLAGRRIVELVGEGLRPSQILTRRSFVNAVRVNAAIGGSTNAVIHLIALAGRLGVPLDLDDFDLYGRELPVLADLQPSGTHLMESFHDAGGMPALLSRVADQLDLDTLTISGRTLGQEISNARVINEQVIRPLDDPLHAEGGIAVVRGNLCPDGAVIKLSAASPRLLHHRGRAVVFDSLDQATRCLDDPDFPVDATDVLVLRNCGPRGYPGMPEVGSLPIPKRLLADGLTDMVRISDARMSGTSYGTVVLHAAPEAAVGGPLGLVENGDEIHLDVTNRSLNVAVTPREMERRQGRWRAAEPYTDRGYLKLYIDHVMQADRGADLDFLVGGSGHAVPPRSF